MVIKHTQLIRIHLTRGFDDTHTSNRTVVYHWACTDGFTKLSTSSREPDQTGGRLSFEGNLYE